MAYGWTTAKRDWNYHLPGIWARYVVSQSQWPVDRIDRMFFPSRAQTRSAGPAERPEKTEVQTGTRGSSAFRRYLACKSMIDFGRYEAASNPFLQIDSCWSGTFRFLAAPFVSLFRRPIWLRHVQYVMLLTNIELRALCFSGVSNAMCRTYAEPRSEVTAIADAWKAMDTPRLRAHHFPDFLGMTLGWVQEAALLADRSRLELIQGYEVLPDLFGISFAQLDFLEPEFARFLDVLLQLSAVETLDRDPYQFAVQAEAQIWISSDDRYPKTRSLLDSAALKAAVFLGQPMDAKMLAEELVGCAIPPGLDMGPVGKECVSWDRTDLLKRAPQTRRTTTRT